MSDPSTNSGSTNSASTNSDRAAGSTGRSADRSPLVAAPQDIGFWEVLAFGCELAMVIGFAVAGWQLGSSLAVRVLLALTLPVTATGIWAAWMAPNSPRRLVDPARSFAEIAVFALSGAALATAGHPGWGVGLAAVSIVDVAVVAWLRAPRRPPA